MFAAPWRLWLAEAVVLVLAPAVRAADLHVPSQHATIQQAIAAASAGDRVLVQPGTYFEALDFLGKGIEVIGVGGAAVTTIDATGLGTSTVTMNLGEPATTLLQGFTITGGEGRTLGSAVVGGGLYIAAAAVPTVRDCVITGNSAGTGSNGGGGGAYISHTLPAGPVPTLVDCEISGNSTGGSGGGVSAGGALVLRCRIADNQASRGGGCSGGADFIDCTIAANSALGDGGGAYSVRSLAGSVLEGNSAVNFGGGYYDYQLEVIELHGGTFIGNTAKFGGGVCLSSQSNFLFGDFPHATVTGCTFARNTATMAGDGLYLMLQSFTSPNTKISNCNFDDDRLIGPPPIAAGNLIIRNVSPPWFTGASYSNVVGATSSTSIDADPLWVDPANGDYRLQGCSPCIDTGSPLSPLDPDGTRADMGAQTFAAWTDLGGGVPGAFGSSVLAGTGLLTAGDTAGFSLTSARPSTPVFIVLGAASLGAPFKGGTFWPTLDFTLTGLSTNASGALALSAAWPSGIPCGFDVYVQLWWLDAGGVGGWAGSNGLRGLSR